MTAPPPIDFPAPGTFFLPGPTEVRAEILAAMARPMISHRSKIFEGMFARIQEGLRAVFLTVRPVFVSSSSATGFMEGAVRCAPAGPILSVVGGAFGERFAEIGRKCERDVDVLDVPLGRAADPDDVAKALGARRYAAVTVVHSESSTGALTDIRAVAAAANANGALCLVDSVTGAAGAELRVDEWGIGFALTGSQKALALPPGLAFGVASAEYIRQAQHARGQGMYFDLAEFEEFAKKNQTPNTPALPLLYALDAQLALVREETVTARWARHRAMAETTHRWAESLGERLPGVGILAPEGERSPTVSAITLPDGITGDDVVKGAKARGYTIGGGYGPLKGRTFRVGHMGDHTVEGVTRVLGVCEEVLATSLDR
jgi:aspartate aminotransferase-like enzyme